MRSVVRTHTCSGWDEPSIAMYDSCSNEMVIIATKESMSFKQVHVCVQLRYMHVCVHVCVRASTCVCVCVRVCVCSYIIL